MIMPRLVVEKIYEDAQLPVKAHSSDSGFDLFAHRFMRHYSSRLSIVAEFEDEDGKNLETILLYPNERVMIGTGIRAKVDTRGTAWETFNANYDTIFELQIRPRSGTALKRGLTVTNTPGTIDAGYTGEICIVLSNISDIPQGVNLGERIAQMVPVPVLLPELVEGKVLVSDTRGDGGFNSTGTSSTGPK